MGKKDTIHKCNVLSYNLSGGTAKIIKNFGQALDTDSMSGPLNTKQLQCSVDNNGERVPKYGKQNGLENDNSNDQKQGTDIEEDG
jgi:hypothetical protein